MAPLEPNFYGKPLPVNTTGPDGGPSKCRRG